MRSLARAPLVFQAPVGSEHNFALPFHPHRISKRQSVVTLMSQSKSTKHICKSLVKHWIFCSRFLIILFSLLYRFGGRKPWGLSYTVYKFAFIKDTIENKLNCFNERSLPPGFGSRLDERVVEYPWLLSKLKDSERIILDAGSVLNHEPILTQPAFKNRAIYITTLSHEGFPCLDPTPSYVYEDLRDMSFKTEFFEAIVCLSTLEHVGMDNTFLYTQDKNKKENDLNAYLAAVKELKRVLKRGGTLYLTLPYGLFQNHGWLQVFDAAMIQRLIEAFSPSAATEMYFKYERSQWNVSTEPACCQGVYFDIHRASGKFIDGPVAAQCVACLELTK